MIQCLAIREDGIKQITAKTNKQNKETSKQANIQTNKQKHQTILMFEELCDRYNRHVNTLLNYIYT